MILEPLHRWLVRRVARVEEAREKYDAELALTEAASDRGMDNAAVNVAVTRGKVMNAAMRWNETYAFAVQALDNKAARVDERSAGEAFIQALDALIAAAGKR